MPCIWNKKPPKKQGAMDRFFLLDTVRHISRYYNSVLYAEFKLGCDLISEMDVKTIFVAIILPQLITL
jgi:hypothetical protein